MLSLSHSVAPKSILLMGAHCDDIEIGCGATVLHLVEKFPEAHFDWVVFSSTPERAQEAMRSSDTLLANARSKTVIIQNFRNGYFPYVGAQIKDYFESLKIQTRPEWIFTHHSEDRHQDHRILAELTWNTFRNHLIFEYEVPKYDGGWAHRTASSRQVRLSRTRRSPPLWNVSSVKQRNHGSDPIPSQLCSGFAG